MQIAINVQHYELRHLAQYIKPNDIAAGWAALGFDPINPRWGKTKLPTSPGSPNARQKLCHLVGPIMGTT